MCLGVSSKPSARAYLRSLASICWWSCASSCAPVSSFSSQHYTDIFGIPHERWVHINVFSMLGVQNKSGFLISLFVDL